MTIYMPENCRLGSEVFTLSSLESRIHRKAYVRFGGGEITLSGNGGLLPTLLLHGLGCALPDAAEEQESPYPVPWPPGPEMDP